MEIYFTGVAVIIAAIIGVLGIRERKKVEQLKKTKVGLLKDWFSFYAIEERLIKEIVGSSNKSTDTVKKNIRKEIEKLQNRVVKYKPSEIKKMLTQND